MSLQLESSAFEHEAMIPTRFTCDGDDINHDLKWSGAPEGTQSFAMINDDPDAPVGLWVHWVIYDIPASTAGLPEDVDRRQQTLPDGSKQGRNSWGRVGYGGPCPPSGTHRYFFKLYALDTMLNLPPGATKDEVERAMGGHILAEAELMGRYRRSR